MNARLTLKDFLERLFPSVGKKVAFAVAVVLLVSGGSFLFFAHRTGYGILDQQVQMKAAVTSKLMGSIIDHVMLEGEHRHLNNVIRSALTSPDILNVYILRSDGSVALDAKSDSGSGQFPVEQFHNILGDSRARMVLMKERESLFGYLAMPIQKKPQCATCHPKDETIRGYFAMKLAMDDIRSVALQHRTTNIAMTVLVFGGLGIIIYLALSFLVIKPIGKLHSHIRRIERDVKGLASGEKTEFPLLPTSDGRDEIADLCRDFNNLVQRLNDANAELYELHRAQLEYADRLATTGQIAASMAHEIKNPIAGVLGALQVFDSELSTNDGKKEILAEMMVQLERVNHAVNDLLSYARPTSPVFEEVCVDDVIQKTLSLLKQQMQRSSIAIRTNFPGEGTVIEADRKQFQQVVWNVMLNAMQAMGSSGILSVSVARENASATIRIADTGGGIPPDQLASVFKPFFTTKHKGTGLGMTISKRIVEQHHGSITVESTVGKGTIVTLVLPQRQP